MAYDFDGTDDYIEATSAAVTAVPISMSAWFNTSNITNSLTVMSIASSTGSHRWGIRTGGSFAGDPVGAYTQNGATIVAADTTTGYSANTWHHAGAVFTANNSRTAYIDGGSSATNTNSVTPSAALVNRTTIGSSWTGGARVYWPGKIAEVGIWNVALDDAEIEALAEGIRPSLVRPQNLVFYAPLVREVIDYRGLSLTTSGAVVDIHPRRIA